MALPSDVTCQQAQRRDSGFPTTGRCRVRAPPRRVCDDRSCWVGIPLGGGEPQACPVEESCRARSTGSRRYCRCRTRREHPGRFSRRRCPGRFLPTLGPVVGGDEFTYRGAPDPIKWSVYDGPGHNGNGLRSPTAWKVANGVATVTGSAARPGACQPSSTGASTAVGRHGCGPVSGIRSITRCCCCGRMPGAERPVPRSITAKVQPIPRSCTSTCTMAAPRGSSASPDRGYHSVAQLRGPMDCHRDHRLPRWREMVQRHQPGTPAARFDASDAPTRLVPGRHRDYTVHDERRLGAGVRRALISARYVRAECCRQRGFASAADRWTGRR